MSRITEKTTVMKRGGRVQRGPRKNPRKFGAAPKSRGCGYTNYFSLSQDESDSVPVVSELDGEWRELVTTKR